MIDSDCMHFQRSVERGGGEAAAVAAGRPHRQHRGEEAAGAAGPGGADPGGGQGRQARHQARGGDVRVA